MANKKEAPTNVVEDDAPAAVEEPSTVPDAPAKAGNTGLSLDQMQVIAALNG